MFARRDSASVLPTHFGEESINNKYMNLAYFMLCCHGYVVIGSLAPCIISRRVCCFFRTNLDKSFFCSEEVRSKMFFWFLVTDSSRVKKIIAEKGGDS